MSDFAVKYGGRQSGKTATAVARVAVTGPAWLPDDAVRRGFVIERSRMRRGRAIVVLRMPAHVADDVVYNCRSVDGKHAGHFARRLS